LTMARGAEAVSYGAVTIVNAMATGKGAALGIKLWTRAKVTLTSHRGLILGRNLSDPNEKGGLAEATAKRVFHRFGYNKRLGAIVETESNIPIAVGLKSSSAASNAVALACVKALGRKTSDIEIVKLGVEASLRAGVTLTGAFDDACACYLGGVVITDNLKRRILKRFKPGRRFRVLVHVPKQKKYTHDVDPAPLKEIRPVIRVAYREALRGNYWNSLTLNGLAYSNAFGYDTVSTTAALNAGAVAAGLTGKGPAVVAVVRESDRDNVRAVWRRLGGLIIETTINFQKAKAMRLEA
jgi:shikimate kinase